MNSAKPKQTVVKASLLLVDDEASLLRLFKSTLGRSGYHCQVADNGEAALQLLEKQPFDVVVTDIAMPVMDGMALTKKVIESYGANVIVMTGKSDIYKYDQFISIGASDFVEKPFTVEELELRIRRVLNERRLKLRARAAHLELKEAYLDSIHRLVMASEYKDENTGDHIIRIGKFSRFMAMKMGLDKKEIETMYYASPMHDIGKIGIPDHIILKPGELTSQEFEIMKTHTIIGAKLLSRSKSAILQMAEEIAISHHEKFNGQGYPNGLSKEEIPLSGRIVAIVDTFDALTSKRPYKDPYSFEKVYDIIKGEREKHFDPSITDLFIDNFSYLFAIREKIGHLGDTTI
nr:HD domain-containing phosphohydrolase [uncultured Desulfobacter sp.]